MNGSDSRAKKTALLTATHWSPKSLVSRYGQWHELTSCDRFSITAHPAEPGSARMATVAIVAAEVHCWAEDMRPSTSDIAIEAILATVESLGVRDPVVLLEAGFRQASRRIREVVASRHPVSCAAVIVLNERLYVASCGNCRIVLVRAHSAKQVGLTHTFVEVMIEQGHTTWDSALISPYDVGGPIRALGDGSDDEEADLRLRWDTGAGDVVAVENQGLCLQPDDRLLLLSPGFFRDFFTPQSLVMLENAFGDVTVPPQEAVERFTEPYRTERPHTDLTVILLQIPPVRVGG